MHPQPFILFPWQGTRHAGFYVYDAGSGALLAETGPAARSLDLAGLGLPDGPLTLAVEAVDDYGTTSGRVELAIELDGGVPAVRYVAVSDLGAQAIAGGKLELSWSAYDPAQQRAFPAEWEVGDADGAVLQTVTPSGKQTRFRGVETAAFTSGSTVRLFVRASDGVPVGSGGRRGAWASFPAVVADADAPSAPVLVL